MRLKYLAVALLGSVAVYSGGIVSAQVHHFDVSVNPTSFTTKDYPTITITAVTSGGATVTGYAGSVAFDVIPPEDAFFLPSNSTHTFAASESGSSSFTGVDFPGSGDYTIRVHDLYNPSLTGSTTIAVSHSNELDTPSISGFQLTGYMGVTFSLQTGVKGVAYSFWDVDTQKWGHPFIYESPTAFSAFTYLYFNAYGDQQIKITALSGGHQASASSIFSFSRSMPLEDPQVGSAGPVGLILPQRLISFYPDYIEYTSALGFGYGGNAFEGLVYARSYDITPVSIVHNGQTISNCKKQLRGFYYSNPRGYRVWPLDTQTLSTFRKNIHTSYGALSLTGGLFYDCSGVNSTSVYGQIKHTINGVDYSIIAGVNFDLTGNKYANALSGTTTFLSGAFRGWLFDSQAGVAKINSGSIYTSVSPNAFSISVRRNATPSHVYQSSMVIIQGLPTNVTAQAMASAGVLFVNGVFKGKTANVQNGDVVRIELIANKYYADHDDYQDSVSILTIGTKSAMFVIENKDSADEEDGDAGQYSNALTSSLRFNIHKAFQELVDAYDSKSTSRQVEVFLALNKVIEEKAISIRLKIKSTTSSSTILRYKKQLTILDYLYEDTVNHLRNDLDVNLALLDDELDDSQRYETPNEKFYRISYDTAKGYFSADMKTRKYFATLNHIKRFLDINNPPSGHDINSRIMAPGDAKKYNVIKNEAGKYGSLYFTTPIWFNNLSEMIAHVAYIQPYAGNDCSTQDTDKQTYTHQTPNGKVYTLAYSTKDKRYSMNTKSKLCFSLISDLTATLDALNMRK